jgi:acid phosphatase
LAELCTKAFFVHSNKDSTMKLATSRLGIALSLLICGSVRVAVAQELSQFDIQSTNEAEEPQLVLKVTSAGKERLKLSVPTAALDMLRWQRDGQLVLDWRGCRTREMQEGRGELNQCVRRAFLSLDGEADRLVPAKLTLQITADYELQVDYQPTPGLYHSPQRYTATTSHAGAQWKAFLERVTPRPREPHAAKLGPADESTQFVFFGDAGTGDDRQKAVARGIEQFCARSTCQFALVLGDNFYSDGVRDTADKQWRTKFEVPYQNLHFPFYPVLGNHDHHGNTQAQIDYSTRSDKWVMPGRYYSLEKGDVALFGIDSDDFDEGQAQWLERQLQATQRRWRIVYAHHPIYSYGAHGDSDDLKRKLLPVLRRGKVDFYLTGHDHDQQVIVRDGMNFIVVGSGGASVRPVSRGTGTVFARSAFGFAHLNISGSVAHLRILDQNGDVVFEREVTGP